MRKVFTLAATAAFAATWSGCPSSGGTAPTTCGTTADPCHSSLDCCTSFICLSGACIFQGGGLGNGGENGSSGSSGGSGQSSSQSTTGGTPGGSGTTGGGTSTGTTTNSAAGSTGHGSTTGQGSGSSGGSGSSETTVGSGSTSGGNTSGGSTGAGNSSGNSGTGSTGGGSSGGGSTSNGGSTGTGTTSGGSTSGGTTGATPVTYCDGLQVTSGSNDPVLLQTYLFSAQLTTDGCAAGLAADADGASLSALGGIYDLDVRDNGATTPADAVFPAGCDDLALSSFVPPSGVPYTPPTGALTIAGAYATTGTVAIYGVVTGINPWAATPTAYNGTVYLQDPTNGTPAPHSGVLVYFPKANAATYGTIPVRGDVVEVTNVTWSPYKGQNQFLAGATSVVSVLGTSPLPPPVPLGSADVGPTATTNGQLYVGMRVAVADGPFTVSGSAPSGDCPAGLEDTVP